MTAAWKPTPHETTPRWRSGIVLLLIAVVLIRLPFWPGVHVLRDGIAYSIGALVTHVAHPPGSVGYCVLGGWLNSLVGHIETTFIDINLVAGLLGTYCCYRFALSAQLPDRAALLAAATYGLSINTLSAALAIAPHLLEGVGTILTAWLGLLALQRHHRGFALACTLTVALIGSFRPTATAFLIPMWLFAIYQSEARPFLRRLPMLIAHLTLLTVICAGWSVANNYYMTRAGYGGTTYEKQVLTIAPYDYVSLSTDVQASANRHTYHLPAAEMLAWLEPRLHVRLLPHIPDWPTPSLSRAIKLSIQQSIKQATFLLVSIPALGVVALLVIGERITGRRLLRWNALPRNTWILLICCCTPAALFFVFGHLGTLTYLQNYLGALSVACAALLTNIRRSPDETYPSSDDDQKSQTKPRRDENGGTNPIADDDQKYQTKPRPASRRSGTVNAPPWLTFWPATFCVAGSALVFAVARPINTTNAKLNLLNVSLLQYTGPAKAAGYGAARINAVLNSDPAAAAIDRDYENVHGDRELIDAALRNHFEYLNPDPAARAAPGAGD